MKAATLLAAATAALSLPLSAQASSSSSHHGPNSAAHSRRFNRVLRGPEDAPVIDLEAEGFSVRNASLVAQGDSTGEGELHNLSKRGYSGRATFFEPGLGACGTYSSSSDYMVAMNQAQYGDLGAVSSWCFQTITISYGGKTANAQVLDACPGCPYGGLDFSPSLFKHFADESVGVFYMNWAPAGSGSGNNNGGNDDAEAKKSKEAAAAASSSSAAAAWASSSSAAAAWASSSSSRAAAWASSSSSAHNAWLASSSSSSASAASAAASAAAASRESAQSVASVASAAAAASASDAALSIAAASAASVASLD
ncbi:hypothetical protein DMC30DRAFT_265805 [Rhodotorula diobovata]|uniref:RlpA-like double-psi beta-barrel-protein domain-containing protein-containing protein n=1 Tax=Rhodotorula diobovata TaxID=5288 RepID=A0A5C5FWZ4_9BASI|nr:hypothetical protein DMC30DRAFT_265805 [Rhodotorula diobovata]